MPGASRPGSSGGAGGKSLHPLPAGKINWIYSSPTPRAVITGEGENEKRRRRIPATEYILEFESKVTAKFLPAMIYFYSSDFKNKREVKLCHRLNAKVYTADGVVKASRKFACIAIDFTKLKKSLRIVFRVRSAPTVIFYDCFGNELSRHGNPYAMSPATYQRLMLKVLKRNEYTVRKHKKKLAEQKKAGKDLQSLFEKADALMEKGEFDDARALYERVAANDIDEDLAEWARLRIEEIGIGVLYFQGLKALDAKDYGQAEKKLLAVARSGSRRYADLASNLLEELPAARLFHEALADYEAGKNYPAMQKLQKVLSMENAGRFREKARQKLQEIKDAWNKKVK